MSPARIRAHTRPPVRQAKVVLSLARRIVAGDWQPGERLPTRERLMAEFGVSSITIQRACDELTGLGAVTAHGPLGTFVAARPPHRHRVALLFPNAPGNDGSWSRFYRVIERTAQALLPSKDLTRGYAMVERPESMPAEAITHQAELGLFAGLLFAYNPLRHGADSPLVRSPVPKVGVFSSAIPRITTLMLDHADYARRIAERLAQRGARRVALLANSDYLAHHSGALLEALAARGLAVRPQWRLGIDLQTPEQATAVVRLLFAPWSNDHPDALVITDDHLEDAALAGLISDGVRIGDAVTVITHANFPHDERGQLPLIRVGFDAGTLVQMGLTALREERDDRARAGRVLLVPAQVSDDPPSVA